MNVPTILKNSTWSTKKYNAIEDLKRTKANMFMFDMLQNCPQKLDALMKIWIIQFFSHNTNTNPQNRVS